MAHNQKLRDQQKEMMRAIGYLQEQLANLSKDLDVQKSIILAIQDIVGVDAVAQRRKERTVADIKSQNAEAQSIVQMMVDGGAIAKSDSEITPLSFVMLSETLPELNESVLYYHSMRLLPPEQQASYLGKKTGDVVEIPGYSPHSVYAVYTVDEQKAMEYDRQSRAAAQNP